MWHFSSWPGGLLKRASGQLGSLKWGRGVALLCEARESVKVSQWSIVAVKAGEGAWHFSVEARGFVKKSQWSIR